MNQLSESNCEACSVDAQLLSQAEIETLLPEIDGWEIVEESNVKKLTRTFQTKNYKKSMAFTNAVAELAESVNHHPQLIVEYGTVTVIWWTHKINGLHKNDFILASRTADLFLKLS